MTDQTLRWTDAASTERASASDLNGFAAIALLSFWGAFVVIYSLRSALLGSNPMDNMAPRILVAVLGAGLSWLMYVLLDRLRPGSIMGAMACVLAVSVPISILFALGHELVFTPLATAHGPACIMFAGGRCPPQDTWTAIVDNTINWTFLFAAWGLIQLSARSTFERWAADNRASEQREAARMAEIRALRYQVNPHFLFNCLNSLATLVRRPDPSEAELMIGELGAFLRYGLATDLLTDVDLRDEVEMQQRYLTLECRRFAHRLTVDIDIAEAAKRARVPSLILQPLVENAVRHGVAMTAAHTRVAIRAKVAADERLFLTVEDDAWAGLGEEGASGSGAGFGIGLRNVSDRLTARFGIAASCRTIRLPKGGFRAEISMPLVVK